MGLKVEKLNNAPWAAPSGLIWGISQDDHQVLIHALLIKVDPLVRPGFSPKQHEFLSWLFKVLPLNHHNNEDDSNISHSLALFLCLQSAMNLSLLPYHGVHFTSSRHLPDAV